MSAEGSHLISWRRESALPTLVSDNISKFYMFLVEQEEEGRFTTTLFKFVSKLSNLSIIIYNKAHITIYSAYIINKSWYTIINNLSDGRFEKADKESLQQ